MIWPRLFRTVSVTVEERLNRPRKMKQKEIQLWRLSDRRTRWSWCLESPHRRVMKMPSRYRLLFLRDDTDTIRVLLRSIKIVILIFLLAAYRIYVCLNITLTSRIPYTALWLKSVSKPFQDNSTTSVGIVISEERREIILDVLGVENTKKRTIMDSCPHTKTEEWNQDQLFLWDKG